MAARWWSPSTIAVVTGGNKGIGLEIVRQLASQGVTTVLTARDEGRGKAAVESLQAGGVPSVVFRQLDVASEDSVDRFGRWLKAEYGGLDILVNNAGILYRMLDFETAKQTMSINYHALVRMSEAMLPLLRPSAAKSRIVNIASVLGQRNNLSSPALREKFGDPNLSKEDIDKLVDQYLAAVEGGTSTKDGWGNPQYQSYCVSKCAVIAYTFALARQLAVRNGPEEILLNAVHPGYVKTDMSPAGVLSVEEGADTAVWLALGPPDGPTGKFYSSRKEMAF